MAKENKNGTQQVKFINFDFDEATKKQFKVWRDKNRGQLSELVDKLVDSSFGISCKVDSWGGGCAAYIQSSDPKSPVAGWVLSGRASSASNAMLSVMYRHLVVFQGDWPTDDVRRRGLDDE